MTEYSKVKEILDGVEIEPSEHRELWEKIVENSTMTCRPISKKDPFGILLPVRQNEEESYFL
ncbi:MAG: hypothetical protein WCG98_04480 [bacterium]